MDVDITPSPEEGQKKKKQGIFSRPLVRGGYTIKMSCGFSSGLLQIRFFFFGYTWL
jgi:hypothetical protein